ncbi:ATP-dependent Lon protease pim1 [Globomyces sp. JEL0801]|nr:ATP-dependent Lon protease pim1 [Globomyces sp. JEL0801]
MDNNSDSTATINQVGLKKLLNNKAVANHTPAQPSDIKYKLKHDNLDVSMESVDTKQESSASLPQHDILDDLDSDFDSDLDDRDSLPDLNSPGLRKWNTEAALGKSKPAFKRWESQPIPFRHNLGTYLNLTLDTRIPTPSTSNPLRKWRETHLKQLERSLDLIEIEESIPEIGPKPKNPSSDAIVDGIECQSHHPSQIPSQIPISERGSDITDKNLDDNYDHFDIKSDLNSLELNNVSKIQELNVIPKPIPNYKQSRSLSETSALTPQARNQFQNYTAKPAVVYDAEKYRLFDDQDDSEFSEDIEAQATILDFKSKYTSIRQIGTGGHSTVRLVIRNNDSKPLVAKFIHSSNVWHWYDASPRIPLEIAMMQKFLQIGLKEVIEYHEHYSIGKRFIIVMEYLGDGWVDLYDYIELFGPVAEDRARFIFHGVVEIIVKMHLLGYSHNDIKDENIMINKETLELKLIDFGSTMPLCDQCTTTFYGTQKFSSPEALGGNPYLPSQQEVWALGTLLYVLIFKMDPFANDEEILELDIESRIDRLRSGHSGHTPIELSDECVQAICFMLSKVPEDRPRIDELLDMPFFANSHE